MAKHPRSAAREAITATVLAVMQLTGSAQSQTPAASDAPAVIRTGSSSLRIEIDRAMEESPTFRRLVHDIQARAGIVYVDEGECRGRRRACLVSVTRAGAHRILWVKIDARRDSPDVIAGLIGHELQHVVEVLTRPAVIDNATMFLLYDRDGPRRSTFETEAAIQAGDGVRAELQRFSSK